MSDADVVIIGAGIVGLATAWRLIERSDLRPLVLDKEPQVAAHQTGRNSGVIHSGMYYAPGSLKARNCRRGKQMLETFCARHDVPFDICGKVIVAVDQREVEGLERIYQRGVANGVTCEMIGPERLAELEPHARGVRAIHVPEAGIVDFGAVARRLAELIASRGGHVRTGVRVAGVDSDGDGVTIQTGGADEIRARWAINCAGLHSDRVARAAAADCDALIIPFRGEYYDLRPQARALCRNLIYPTPNPAFPFLGVHFTRMIGGGVECGPNAVLALAREGYRWRDINLRDLAESLGYPGFRKIARRNWRTGTQEMWRSISKRAFVRALRRLVPEITAADLERAPAGVRAQALRPDGALVDDFLITRTQRMVHVCNAPSPAATSSLSVGDHIIDELASLTPPRMIRPADHAALEPAAAGGRA
ncbi:MAG: L-2-hydroxyglutarate oxidase [Phycisphaerales bacterium JB039]